MTDSPRFAVLALGVPLVPLAWNFVVPAFLGFLVGTTYVLTFGLLAAVMLWGISTVLLLLWLATGLYPFNRLALIGYAVGAALVVRGLGELAARCWRRARGRPRLAELRPSDVVWAGASTLDLMRLARAGVRVAPLELDRRAPDASARRPAPGSAAEDLFDVYTRLPRGGPAHVARIEHGTDGAALEVDRLTRATWAAGDAAAIERIELARWLELLDRADAALARPTRLRCVRTPDGALEVHSCEPLAEVVWARSWVAGAGVDLAADPVSTLERELVESAWGWDRLLVGRAARDDVTFLGQRPYVSFEAARGGSAARGAAAAPIDPMRAAARRVRVLARDLLLPARGLPRRGQVRAGARLTPRAALDSMRHIARDALEPMLAWTACATRLLAASSRVAAARGAPSPARLRRIQRPEVTHAARLADDLARFDRLVPASLRAGVATWDAVRARVANQPDRLAAIDALLRRHGHRGPGERTLAGARWSDGPAVLGELDAIVAASMPMPAAVAEAHVPWWRLAWLDPLEWWLDGLVALGAFAMARRVRCRDRATRASASLRAALLAEGEALVAAGKLERADDVFHLRLNEWLAAAEGSGELRVRVRERRAELDAARRSRAPAIVTDAAGGAPPLDARAGTPGVCAAQATLFGIAASAGSMRGRVFHAGDTLTAADPRDAHVVLVLDDANPHHAALLARASALVCERGGLLSHLAIVARELGVPAVMGVAGATAALAVGTWVEVDGSRGVVRPLTARA